MPRIKRAACASERTGTGPSVAAMPPKAPRVTSVTLAPNSAARSAAITPAGPAPMTTTFNRPSRRTQRLELDGSGELGRESLIRRAIGELVEVPHAQARTLLGKARHEGHADSVHR